MAANKARSNPVTAIAAGGWGQLKFMVRESRRYGELRETPYGLSPFIVITVVSTALSFEGAALGIALPDVAQDLRITESGLIGISIMIAVIGAIAGVFVAYQFDRVQACSLDRHRHHRFGILRALVQPGQQLRHRRGSPKRRPGRHAGSQHAVRFAAGGLLPARSARAGLRAARSGRAHHQRVRARHRRAVGRPLRLAQDRLCARQLRSALRILGVVQAARTRPRFHGAPIHGRHRRRRVGTGRAALARRGVAHAAAGTHASPHAAGHRRCRAGVGRVRSVLPADVVPAIRVERHRAQLRLPAVAVLRVYRHARRRRARSTISRAASRPKSS